MGGVNSLQSRSSGPGSSPGKGYCVVFLGNGVGVTVDIK